MMLPVLSALLAFAVGLFRSRASLCLTPGAAASIGGLQTDGPSAAPPFARSPVLGLAIPSLVRLASHSGVRPATHGDRVAAAISRPLAAPEPTRHIWVGVNNSTRRFTGCLWG